MTSEPLATMFATDRSAGLADTLPPRTRRRPPADPAQPPPATAEAPHQAQTDPPAPPQPAAPAPAPKPGSAPASAASTGGTRSIIIYITPAQRDRLRRAAHTATMTDVVLDAVESVSDRLADLLAAPTPRTDGLFPRTPPARHDDLVQVNIRPLAAAVDTLDQLADQHDSNRSALVRAALDAYLT